MSGALYVTLVILLYGAAATGLVYFIVKKPRLAMTLLGIAAILGAVPIGLFVEVGISGCCGAPSPGKGGLGFVIGALVGIAGIVLLMLSKKFKKTGPQTGGRKHSL